MKRSTVKVERTSTRNQKQVGNNPRRMPLAFRCSGQSKTTTNQNLTTMIKSTEAAAALREKLQQGETHFVFKKKDGSRRQAVGTLNFDIIPKDDWPVTADDIDSDYKDKNEGVVTYYDLEKMAWRCCKTENILEIEWEEVENV